MTYYNYLGQPMPETAPEQSNVLGTSAGGETLWKCTAASRQAEGPVLALPLRC